MRCLDGFTDSMDMSLNNRDIVKDREAWYGAVCGVTKIRTQLSDWTELKGSFVSPALPCPWEALPLRGCQQADLPEETVTLP